MSLILTSIPDRDVFYVADPISSIQISQTTRPPQDGLAVVSLPLQLLTHAS